MNQHIAIVGLGWLGEPLGIHLSQLGHQISGSTTTLPSLHRLVKHPFYVTRIFVEPTQIQGDWHSLTNDCDVLIINIPPKRVPNIEEVYPQQMQQIIQHTPKDKKVIFVSSTSVYQNTNALLSEEINCQPEKASGVGVLAAEELMKAHFGNNVTILRLAGLIGPKRHPGRFLAGKRKLKNPNVPVNLIHLEDCIGLIQAIIEQEAYGHTLNGCADEHPQRATYYTEAAQKLGLTAPIFEENQPTSYKIVSNEHSKAVLGYQYQFANPKAIFDTPYLPEISIIGSGPGNKQLLTLEATLRIANAEIILHDNLVSDAILGMNTQAEKVYVGRKYGDSSNQTTRQNRINELLAQYCREGKKVVRLKSGDPYVFGRAAEEARYLAKENLPFNVIPGVTAALAAADLCNIPITEREKSNAILICTAHTADYSFDQLKGIAELLKAGNALALYMGLKSLHRVIPKLLEICQDDTITINAISNVSRPNQVLLSSTLGKIEHDLQNHPLEMPVVFLIGTNLNPIQA